MILGDIEVGDGAIIAANAVVTKSIPAGCTVAGIPAKIVKRKDMNLSSDSGTVKAKR